MVKSNFWIVRENLRQDLLKVEPVYFRILYISAGNDEHKNKDISGELCEILSFFVEKITGRLIQI